MRLSDRCILQVVHPGSLVDYVDCGGQHAIRNHLATLLERSSVFRDDSLVRRPQITTGMVWETGPWAFLKFRLFVCWNWSSSDFSKGRITKKDLLIKVSQIPLKSIRCIANSPSWKIQTRLLTTVSSARVRQRWLLFVHVLSRVPRFNWGNAIMPDWCRYEATTKKFIHIFNITSSERIAFP